MLWAIRDIPAGHPVVLNYNEFVDSYFEDEHKPIEAAQEATTEQEKAKEGTKPNQREEDEEKEGGAGNESDATTTNPFANIPQIVGRV